MVRPLVVESLAAALGVPPRTLDGYLELLEAVYLIRRLPPFVKAEIARQLTWAEDEAQLLHYRTRDGVEVDGVLEARDGRVVGMEVKAASTVTTDDFRHLHHLAARTGADFVCGVVLYTGPDVLSFGPNLWALPVDALWRTPPPT